MLLDLGLIVLAYLLGSCSFGLLMARLYGGVDPRQRGSGNIGATHVARTVGKGAGALTLLGDCVKGVVAVALAQWWGSSSMVSAAAALRAGLGHIFPLYHGFRGDKGIATALGALLPMLPVPLLGGCAVWLAVVAVWRYVSAGSILAAIAVPVLAVLLAYPPPMTGAAIGISLLVLYRHRGNMQRLLQGRELKF